MMQCTGGGNRVWTPLDALRARFEQNLAALEQRDPGLAERVRAARPSRPYLIATDGSHVLLARGGEAVEPLTARVTPDSARRIVEQLASSPSARGPVLISGLDLGWLWDGMYRADINVASAPGHRLPVYLLCAQVERLWVAMHLHDWRDLLGDRRCRIFAGPDAAAQLEAHLLEHPELAPPTVNVMVDDSLWPVGQTLDGMLSRLSHRQHESVQQLVGLLGRVYADASPGSWARRVRSGEKLRVMGITSRFTTFLQHSMRDWLESFESGGHVTHLLIEQADFETLQPLIYLRAIADFRPDLLLLIDHYRAELPHLPGLMPTVMWVQDRLPNIFSISAGEAQGPLDFVIGYGRRDCVTDHAYPRARFMEAPVGVNERRFASGDDAAVDCPAQDAPRDAAKPVPTPGSPSAAARAYSCDVAFVSHASEPADRILRAELDRNASPHLRKLLRDVYERLEAVYARDESVTAEHALLRLIETSMTATGVKLSDVQPMLDLVSNRLNNALFRHQSLEWLLDAGVDLRLYGRGWESHPKFARFARGVADNQTQLARIYRGARINLQVTPYGSAHQRLFEGLCAGGFFLLRHVTADDVEPLYVQLYEIVRRRGIGDDHALRADADERTRALLGHIEGLTGQHPLEMRHDFVDALRALADGGFLRSSSTIWPGEFDRVAFRSRDELIVKVGHYLKHAQERRDIAEAMRRRVLRQVTYRAISERMLSFMADHLARASSPARPVPLEVAA